MVDYLSPASGGVGLQGRAAELNEALGVGLSERGGVLIPWDVLAAPNSPDAMQWRTGGP